MLVGMKAPCLRLVGMGLALGWSSLMATLVAQEPAPSDKETIKLLAERLATLEKKVTSLEDSLAQLKRDQNSAGPGERRTMTSEQREFQSEQRKRFNSLSDQGRRKFIEAMRDKRDTIASSTPEERMKVARELFDKIQAEDQARRASHRQPLPRQTLPNQSPRLQQSNSSVSLRSGRAANPHGGGGPPQPLGGHRGQRTPHLKKHHATGGRHGESAPAHGG